MAEVVNNEVVVFGKLLVVGVSVTSYLLPWFHFLPLLLLKQVK